MPGIAEELDGQFRRLAVAAALAQVGVCLVGCGGFVRGEVAPDVGQVGDRRPRHGAGVAGRAFAQECVDPAVTCFRDQEVARVGVVRVGDDMRWPGRLP